MDLPIYLITLQETPTRQALAEQVLDRLGLDYRVCKFQRHKEAGWKGCIESHLAVFRQAQQNKHDLIMVCEDNIAIGQRSLAFADNLKRFTATQEWDVLFTGGYILRPWDYCRATQYPGIYETRNNNHGTVSYVIHRRMYEQILELHRVAPIDVHYDIFLSRYRCFIASPLLFIHSHRVVSNINVHSDVWRRVWFHPWCARINEWIFFHQRQTGIIIALLVLLWMWKKKNEHPSV